MVNNKNLVKYSIRVIAMLVVIILFFKWINISESIKYLADTDFFYFGLAMLLIFFANIVKAFRFHALAKALKMNLSLLRVVLVNSMCIIVGRITPGRVGEGIKIMWFDEKKTDLGFCFVLEKVFDVFLVLIIALLGIGIFSDYVNSYILFGIALLFIMVLLFNIDKVLKFITKRDLFEERWFLQNIRKLSFWDWIVFTFWSLVIRLSALILAVLITFSLHIDVSYVLVMIIWNLAIILGQVSALPGGLGAREAGYTFLLSTHAGIATGLAGIAAALMTIVDLIVESILAIVCWVLLKTIYKKKN